MEKAGGLPKTSPKVVSGAAGNDFIYSKSKLMMEKIFESSQRAVSGLSSSTLTLTASACACPHGHPMAT